MNAKIVLGATVLAAALAGMGASSAATTRRHVPVYFLRGEQLASVQRAGSTPRDAMRQLLAGPRRQSGNTDSARTCRGGRASSA
jgi:hypothetical protein